MQIAVYLNLPHGPRPYHMRFICGKLTIYGRNSALGICGLCAVSLWAPWRYRHSNPSVGCLNEIDLEGTLRTLNTERVDMPSAGASVVHVVNRGACPPHSLKARCIPRRGCALDLARRKQRLVRLCRRCGRRDRSRCNRHGLRLLLNNHRLNGCGWRARWRRWNGRRAHWLLSCRDRGTGRELHGWSQCDRGSDQRRLERRNLAAQLGHLLVCAAL